MRSRRRRSSSEERIVVQVEHGLSHEWVRVLIVVVSVVFEVGKVSKRLTRLELIGWCRSDVEVTARSTSTSILGLASRGRGGHCDDDADGMLMV